MLICMLFMMKKDTVKKVVLKNPHLRNLRKSLRVILRLKYEEMSKSYINQKINLVDGRKEFERIWDPVMRNNRNSFRKSTLGCQASDCLTYQALLEKKIKEGAPKKNTHFSTIGRQYYEYLSVEELMDVDLVWVHIDGPARWICTKCYENLKKLQDLIPCCGKGEGYDS